MPSCRPANKRGEAMIRSGFGAICLAFSLAACAGAPPSAVLHQPANVGDARIAALHYKASGQYDRDVAVVAEEAQRWLGRHASGVARPALVLDIDDTALSNWPVILRDDFGRPIAGPCDLAADGPCGWAAWDKLAVDEAIAPTLALYRSARA